MFFWGVNTFSRSADTPIFLLAGLADFGFFLLFDEVDDDEREEYDEQKRRTSRMV